MVIFLKKFLKFSFLTVILFCVVLSGCKSNKNVALNNFKTELKNDLSFQITYNYMNLAVNGFSQTLEQSAAKDGSFSFINTFHQWDHTAEFDKTEKLEYFYCYEDGDFVCYMKNDGGETSREVLSSDFITALETEKNRIVGFDALFPSYLEKFSAKSSKGEYTFSLPLEKIVNDNSYLAAYLEQVFNLSQVEYNPEWDVNIICTCITAKDSYKPIKISYNFDELKPYVLSSGALSGETAFDTEFMELTYELNYDLPQSMEKPDIFK